MSPNYLHLKIVLNLGKTACITCKVATWRIGKLDDGTILKDLTI